jgi:hypothetical protein
MDYAKFLVTFPKTFSGHPGNVDKTLNNVKVDAIGLCQISQSHVCTCALFAGFTDKVGVVELSIRKREMSKNFREF